MIVYSIFLILCVYFSYQDIVYGEIQRISLFMAIGAVICIKAQTAFLESAAAAVFGLLMFTVIYYITNKKMGLADIWFSSFAGAFLGIVKWHYAVGIACVTAFLFFMCSKNRTVPFIPFLAFGACLTEGVCLLFSYWKIL